MGQLLREIMEEDRLYREPPEDLLPELIVLGEMSIDDLSLASGKIIRSHVIKYRGFSYLMKSEEIGRWRDKRHNE